jgi:hypothetical protein
MRLHEMMALALVTLLVVRSPLLGQEVKVVSDFEDEAQMKVLQGSEQASYADLSLVTLREAVTSGKQALQVVFHKGIEYPGIAANFQAGFPSDWRGYDYLRLDAYNPGSKPVSFGLRIDDAQSKGYPSRYNGGATLRPGPGTVELYLSSLKVEDGSRNVDLAHITAFMLFFVSPKEDVTLYFDNLRLEKAPAPVQVEGLYRFDFGPENAPTFSGFQPVTPKTTYEESRGFGWVDAKEVEASNQGWPDSLAGDCVHGNTYGRWEFPFAVKLPNGSYTVWVIARNVDQNDMPSRSWRVVAEGKPVIEEAMTAARFYSKDVLYRWLDTDFTSDLDAWKTYIEPRFAPRTAQVTVSDGRLDLTFDTCAVSALIVYPTAREAELAPVLAQLEKDRKKEFYAKHWYLQLPEPERPLAEAIKGHESDPAIVFTPNYLRPLHVKSVPLEGEIEKPITVRVAPGETEPATIAVLAQKDLKDVEVNFHLQGGDPQAQGSCQISLVKVVPRPAGAGVFTPQNVALVPAKPIDIEKGMTRQYWLTLCEPISEPGEMRPLKPHSCTATLRVSFAADGQKGEKRIPVTVEVLPLRLASADETHVSFGWYYSDPGNLNYFFDRFEEMKEARQKELEREFADMVAHGCTGAQFPSPNVPTVKPDGTVEMDFSGLEPWVEAMRKSGLGLKHTDLIGILNLANYRLMRSGLKEFSPEFNKAYMEIVRRTVAWAKEKSVPLAIWAVDEPREQLINDWNRNLADTLKYLDLIAQVPGARSTVTPMGDSQDGVDYMPMVPKMDVMQTHPWAGSAKMIEYAQTHEKPELWTYNAGIDRLSFGFGVWRLKAKGRWQWHYQWHTFPFDPFDEGSGAVYASPDGPIPTVGYEWTREGIDDYRYLFTLKQEMAKAGPERKEAVASAEKLLAEIERDVPPWPTAGLETGAEVGAAYGGPVNAKLDPWRRAAADLIITLQAGKAP